MLSKIELPLTGAQARQAIGLTACPTNLLRAAATRAECAAFSLHDWHARSPLRRILMRLVALVDLLM